MGYTHPGDEHGLQPVFAQRESVIDLLDRWQDRKRLGPAVQSLLQEIEKSPWCVSACYLFDIMGRTWTEDTHTHIIAWLLKPWEAHGLRDRFLREFARRGAGKPLPNGRVRDVVCDKPIGRNNGKIDIEVRGDGWILAVENKVLHVETPGQIEKYDRYYQARQAMGEKVPAAFLTRNGVRAQAGKLFRPMKYRTVREILEGCQADAAVPACEFINTFVEHIRRDLEVSE